jgi:hypothetical protein
MLVGRPSHGLNSGCVIVELQDGFRRMSVPNQQFVIVTSGTELLLIEGPFQSADLLFVPN